MAKGSVTVRIEIDTEKLGKNLEQARCQFVDDVQAIVDELPNKFAKALRCSLKQEARTDEI